MQKVKKTHKSMFLKDVKEAFPEVVKKINSENGLLHMEMHAFLDFVQRTIKDDDVEKVIKAFQIIENHFLNGNKALVNAISVSFLEHLDLGLARNEPSWAYKLFPKSLREPYEELRKYHGI